jgi:hypothetical protein
VSAFLHLVNNWMEDQLKYHGTVFSPPWTIIRIRYHLYLYKRTKLRILILFLLFPLAFFDFFDVLSILEFFVVYIFV